MKFLTCDVAVVGGGPAGSTVSALLAGSGFEVILLEKKSFPRDKLCGGLLTKKTTEFLRRIFGYTVGALKEKGIADYITDEYELIFRGKSFGPKRTGVPFVMVERKVYDSFLAEQARESGARIIENSKVTSFDTEKNILTASSDLTVKSDFVIGADGINSVVRRCFPAGAISSKKWNRDLAIAFEKNVPRKKMHTEIRHPIISFGDIPDGYAWIFPKKDSVVFGMGGRGNKNFSGKFRSFLEKWKIDDADGPKTRGYPLPYGNILKKPSFGRVLLIGDAAGIADPIFGEGIFYAHRSAELAFEAICGAKAGKGSVSDIYAKSLEGIFDDFSAAKKLRTRFLKLTRLLPFEIMRDALAKREERIMEILHGGRDYGTFNDKGGSP